MKRAILAVAALGLFSLAACSEKAKNETAEAADAVPADAEQTGRDAVNDVDAASDAAFDSAENKMDQIGGAADNAADAGGDDAE